MGAKPYHHETNSTSQLWTRVMANTSPRPLMKFQNRTTIQMAWNRQRGSVVLQSGVFSVASKFHVIGTVGRLQYPTREANQGGRQGRGAIQ